MYFFIAARILVYLKSSPRLPFVKSSIRFVRTRKMANRSR